MAVAVFPTCFRAGAVVELRVDADGKLTFTAAIAADGTAVEVRFLNGLMLLIR